MEQSDGNDITRTHVALINGTMVSHYRIIEKIGAGGMGEVYLAEDTKLDRKVALKFLPSHLCQDAECRERFKREAQAAAKLGHANIVAIHEVGEHHGRPFFAMEMVEGRPLNKVVTSGRLSQDEIIELALGICNGLRKAHESGVIHRDVKPSNIMVDRDSVPRVLDFGLAVMHDSDRLTLAGSTLGTIGYMSPEQIGGRDADARSDLFSFGVVLYELITGVNPFMRDNQAATLKAISEDTPEPLAHSRKDTSEELQRIVSKLLEKKPEVRYQTAADLGADLRKLTGSTPIAMRRTRTRWYVAALSAMVIVSGLGITYVLRNKQAPETARKMLAVLPFKNMSSDLDQEYFGDGLTEELTANLSKVHALCVISRSSAMTFKGSNKTIPEIAKALAVQYIVEGSVRKAGKELRITAQLIDATADAHLWANTYTGTLEDVFDMQDSVTRAIVEGIRVQLTPDETRQLGKRSFNSTAAFDYYLRGNNEIWIGTEDAINRGMQSLQQGLDIVGDNALIYCGMAWGYWSMVNIGFAQEEGVSKAQEYAQKALNLNPELPEAHAMLGWINTAFLGDQRKGAEHFKRALVIDPNNESALVGLSVLYFENVGRASAAVSLVERYLVVCPVGFRVLVVQGYLHFFDGAYYRGLELYRKAYPMGQRDPLNGFFYALALAYCDSTREALSIIDESIMANPTGSATGVLLVMKYALNNDREKALLALTPDVKRTCRRDPAWSYLLGAILAKAGAKEEAFDWLENGVNKGSINYPFMEKDPFLDSIRGEERFKKLMERVKHEWEHFEV